MGEGLVSAGVVMATGELMWKCGVPMETGVSYYGDPGRKFLVSIVIGQEQGSALQCATDQRGSPHSRLPQVPSSGAPQC